MYINFIWDSAKYDLLEIIYVICYYFYINLLPSHHFHGNHHYEHNNINLHIKVW